jgi:choline-sulfatase
VLGRLTAFSVLVFQLSAGNLLAQDDPRNLLLISIDTWRADFLSYNGSSRVQTPHLDKLARGGVNFTRARSPVPLTLPSHTSLLTGTYPPTHGVRDNGSYRLGDEQIALAEVLKEHGYETAAFVGAFVLDKRFGLAQGFDVYDDRAWTNIAMLENLEAERSADAVFAVFSQWLQDYEGQKPFFAWVHLYDPHAPYTPPEPYRSRYPQDPYAGEVAYTDAVVGKIVDLLESRELLEEVVIAVVGDHGEGLGEHEETTHSLLIYNSTLHVPMFLYGPGLIPAGLKVDHLTRIIDLAPTLLDYLGVSARFGQGTSLRPLIEGHELAEEIVSYSESLYPSLNLGWSELHGLEVGKHRFILAPRPELYDLSEDPNEETNRIESDPERAQELQERLEALLQSMPSRDASETIDPETKAMLQSLGYVSGGPTRRTGADPKDKMATWNQIHFAMFQFAQEDYSGAIKTLESTRDTEKDIPLIYEYLGSCYMHLNKYKDAEGVYREALGRGLKSSDFHVNLGRIYFERRDLARAEQELETALSLDALNVEAHYRLADVYRAGRKDLKAIEHYQRALDINPDYVYALNGLGMTLTRVGRDDEALAAFEKVVEIDAGGARGYFNLGVQLERIGRNEEALETYETFMSLSTEEEFARERQRATAAIERLK